MKDDIFRMRWPLVATLELRHTGPFFHFNRWVWQMQALLVAFCELTVNYNTLPEVLYAFQHKMEYILIYAPSTHIVGFWHINNIHPMISNSQICYNTPTFCIVAIFFVKYCYPTGSWLL